MSDPYKWTNGINPFQASIPAQLARRGYDVWLGGNRGTLYSNVHKRDGEWTDKERWDFSWADMGIYDLPALIDKVLEVSGEPKLTLIGYSQGASQSIYGLVKKQDYFAERVNRYISLATCFFSTAKSSPDKTSDYDVEVARYLTDDSKGIYSYFTGDDE